MENNTISYITLAVVGLMLVLQLFSGTGLTSSDVTNIVTDVVSTEVGKIQITIPDVNIPETAIDLTELNSAVEDLKTTVGAIVDEDKISELKAEELVLAEIALTRDFRRLIKSTMSDNVSIYSYRDITEIYSIDIEDVNLIEDTEDATVEVDFKVRYFEDGDDEEEDLQRAKLSVTYNVTELDYDDAYEDAEAVNPDFKIIRLYE